VNAIIGIVLAAIGVAVMSASRTIATDDDTTSPLGLVVFFAGCAVVAVGAVFVAAWLREPT
jgi:hypothetical protein